jgi:hypothetical protein
VGLERLASARGPVTDQDLVECDPIRCWLPIPFWIARLATIGWSYSRRETGALESAFLTRREALPLSWMYHNLCVYRPTRGRSMD